MVASLRTIYDDADRAIAADPSGALFPSLVPAPPPPSVPAYAGIDLIGCRGVLDNAVRTLVRRMERAFPHLAIDSSQVLQVACLPSGMGGERG